MTNSTWPELVLGTSDLKISKAISRAVSSGILRKKAARVYTSNLIDSYEEIIKRHRYYLLSKLFPGAIISHASTLLGGIGEDGFVVLTYKYSKRITIAGLTIQLLKGPIHDEDDLPFLDGLYISSTPRAYLENMEIARGTLKKLFLKKR